MNYLDLKRKYVKRLNKLDSDIEDYRNSNNAELQMAVQTLEKQREEIVLLLDAINRQIQDVNIMQN